MPVSRGYTLAKYPALHSHVLRATITVGHTLPGGLGPIQSDILPWNLCAFISINQPLV